MNSQIAIPEDKLAELCRRYHIARLRVFGSALRDDFGPESDLDLLVEFEPGHGVGYITLGVIEEEISALLNNRPVDLLTPNALHPRIQKTVFAEAEVLYEKG